MVIVVLIVPFFNDFLREAIVQVPHPIESTIEKAEGRLKFFIIQEELQALFCAAFAPEDDEQRRLGCSARLTDEPSSEIGQHFFLGV